MSEKPDKVEVSASEMENRDAAIRSYEDYQERFRPREPGFIDRITNPERNLPQLRGQTGADVAQAWDDNGRSIETSVIHKGVGGGFADRVGDFSANRGRADAGAQVELGLDAEARKAKGISTAVKVGRGINAGSMDMLSRESSVANARNVSDAYYDQDKQNARYGAVGYGVGAGLGAWAGGHQKTDPETGKVLRG